MASPVEKERQHNRLEPLSDINRMEVNVVLYGLLAQMRLLCSHSSTIAFGDFSGLDFQPTPRFEVNKLGGATAIIKLHLTTPVNGMEQ